MVINVTSITLLFGMINNLSKRLKQSKFETPIWYYNITVMFTHIN